MVDVFTVIFAALAAVKSIAWYQEFGPAAAAGWFVLCALAPVVRLGWALVALTSFVGWAVGPYHLDSSHLILIGLVALVLAVAYGDDRTYLLRMQTVAVYLFATLNKINGSFLAGAAVLRGANHLPPVPAAIGAVLAEGWMTWAVYRRHRAALPVAALLHVGIVVGMSRDFRQVVMLSSFNGLMVLLVWRTTRDDT